MVMMGTKMTMTVMMTVKTVLWLPADVFVLVVVVTQSPVRSLLSTIEARRPLLVRS